MPNRAKLTPQCHRVYFVFVSEKLGGQRALDWISGVVQEHPALVCRRHRVLAIHMGFDIGNSIAAARPHLKKRDTSLWPGLARPGIREHRAHNRIERFESWSEQKSTTGRLASGRCQLQCVWGPGLGPKA